MQFDSNKISDYLISYYKITDKTPFEIKEVSSDTLLSASRFDLGAKLYYIHSHVTGENRDLAEKLYDNHIAAFQDGIIEEHGNRDKKGFEKYHATLIDLIEKFQTDEFDVDRQYLPVDRNMCLMDGAHRAACSVYFHKDVKIIQFPTIQTYTYDRHFFHAHGLEQGYLNLMEYSLYNHGLDISGKYTSIEHAKQSLGIHEAEKQQNISVSLSEKCRCRIIRFIRNRYTKMVILIKKLLHMPV